MPQNNEPIIKLDPGGKAPILSYNVPDPTSYSGRNFIDLQLPENSFKASEAERLVAAVSDDRAWSPPRAEDLQVLKAQFVAEGEQLSEELENLDPAEAKMMEEAGKEVTIYESLGGRLTYRYTDSIAPSTMDRKRLTTRATPTTQHIFTVEINQPAVNAQISGPHTGARIVVSGSASIFDKRSDGEAFEGTLLSVEVQVGSRPFVSVLSGPERSLGPIGFSHVAEGVTDTGEVTITVVARGRFPTSSTVHSKTSSRRVFVSLVAPDTTAPTVTIDPPGGGKPLSTSNQDGMQVTLAGTASDTGGSGVQRVEVSLDGAAYETANPRAADDWSTWTKALGLTLGNHSIKARAVDKSNNVSPEVTATATVILIDEIDPIVTITSPSQGTDITGPFNGAVVVAEGTVSDAGGSGIAEVQLVVAGRENAPAEVVPKIPGDWSKGWQGSIMITAPGTFFLKARCRDNAGNWGESESVLVEIALVPEVIGEKDRLILVESYRLSSFHGNYGAGRTIKTFSLLPGEKAKISVKTFTKTVEDAKEASSILDSFTETSATNFETSMGNEQSDKKSYEESFKYNVEGKAQASWGWGSASISAGVSGGTNAAREEFAKNISNAVEKHAAEASTKRDVQVNTSYEVKEETGEETSIEREIENINVSRTLNFVFRQMNQEFISILHLVDVRVGYFHVDEVTNPDGSTEKKYTYEETTLPQLESLLREVIVEEKRAEVKDDILAQLNNIFDYEDKHRRFTETEAFSDESGQLVPGSNYLRIRKDLISTYEDEATGTKIDVPGIILAAKKVVLRTEGIMVDALLGHGDGLDAYSHGLQDEAVKAKEHANEQTRVGIEREWLAQQIIRDRDTAAAELFEKLYPERPPRAIPYVIAPVEEDANGQPT